MIAKNTGKLLGLLLGVMTLSCPFSAIAEHLVMVSANDTHSLMDPDSDGAGGAMRRRAIYDDIRRNNPNTLVIHAGDAVQGTVYFSLYGGEVEYAMIDTLGYDIVVLGNHEFDNGIDTLAHYYSQVKHPKKLSANYDMSGTSLDGMFEPYVIKAYGDKRVGFFGINVQPKGLISDTNYKGMRYLPADEVADATARYLKEVQKVDYAIMVSHIGYTAYEKSEPCDTSIVARSHYIDMVIGGHSHTVVKPGTPYAQIANADGRMITVGQNGKWGKIVGVYDLDLETGEVVYKQINVDSKWDAIAAAAYPDMARWLAKYRVGVDSLMNTPICESARMMKNSGQAIQNWLADAALNIIPKLSGLKNIDLAIMNKGGIRVNMPQGLVTEGLLTSMFPFDNRFVVLEMSGQDLLETFAVMAGRDGDAVSNGVKVVYNSKGQIIKATIKGKKIDPKKIYLVGTINYLADGGDYMVPMQRSKRLFVDDVKYGNHILDYCRGLKAKGQKINATDEPRMEQKK